MRTTPEITVYSTGWCPYCVRARALLERKDLAFREIKIDQDPAGRDAMLARSGGRAASSPGRRLSGAGPHPAGACCLLASPRPAIFEPMAVQTLLIIDDEPQIRRVERHALESDGTRVLEAGTGREGIDLAAAERPELIVLDLGLPDMAGADVCRDIRAWSMIPIVVLSARHSDQEKAALPNLGADDYVTKPFSTIELQARVRAQLRRAGAVRHTDGSATVAVDDLAIDLARRSVTRAGARIHVTPIEWELLRVLVSNRGRTMTHGQLFAQVWARAHGDAQQYLRVHIANLRRKLEHDPVQPLFIVTEPGVGYRFESGE